MKKKAILLVAAATTALLALLGAAGAAITVYGGLYNVASTEQHWQPMFSLLETAMRQSVRLRARGVEVPPLQDDGMVRLGAECYRDKCEACHGAPGVAQGDAAKAMQPLPGPLVDARKRWQPRELYWVTRHGIKMSGMPAWELRLNEPELWATVAFLQRLPDLSAADYAAITRGAGGAARCGAAVAAIAPGTAPVRDEAGSSKERGRRALYQYACNACHTIPGVTGSNPDVGPPLEGIAGRALIAGTLPNNHDNLVRWLMHTKDVKPVTAMPQLNVTARDAHDIAAYLETLR